MRPLSKVERALEQVELYGLLLKSDTRLPSVTTLVAGEPVRGSWWGHPTGRQIFHVLEALGDSDGITIVKLISGKDTFIHKRLFPHLVSIGTAREPWQMTGLSAAGLDLYELVQKEGAVSTDNLDLRGKKGSKEAGQAARELEGVLLVHGQSVHTSSGKHTKQLGAGSDGPTGRLSATVLPPRTL